MKELTTMLRRSGIVVLALSCAHCSSSDAVNSPGPASGADASVDTAAEAQVEAAADTAADTAAPAGRCSVTGDGWTTLMFVNRCDRAVVFEGSDIQGAELEPGAVACRDVGSSQEPINSKRYWGYAGADPGAGRYSLAEFTFNTDFQDFDWYDLSHVDAFNLPLQIAAVDHPECRTLTCADDLVATCPAEGRYPAQGEAIACVSPDRDDPNNPVASYFEASCADAYSWSGDDQDSMVACAGEDYDVVFCP